MHFRHSLFSNKFGWQKSIFLALWFQEGWKLLIRVPFLLYTEIKFGEIFTMAEIRTWNVPFVCRASHLLRQTAVVLCRLINPRLVPSRGNRRKRFFHLLITMIHLFTS